MQRRILSRRLGILVVLAVALTGLVLPSSVTGAHAAPVFRPHIDVFAADGVTPIGNTVVHPGDTLVVKGRGFDPNANRGGGFPLPVPPGGPHGTFIAFGAFAPHWKPSAGAPESARAATRLGVQWALAPSALAQVPSAPFDMRRTIRQQWVPLSPQGTFTARVVASTPKDTPAGARYGVYTYGAAGAVNAAQELSVPINYSTTPGANTPKPAPRNLIWAYSPSFYRTVTKQLQGGVYGTDGAGVDDAGRLTFALRDGAVRNGNGVLRFRGTIVGVHPLPSVGDRAGRSRHPGRRRARRAEHAHLHHQHQRHRRAAPYRHRRRRPESNRQWPRRLRGFGAIPAGDHTGGVGSPERRTGCAA